MSLQEQEEETSDVNKTLILRKAHTCLETEVRNYISHSDVIGAIIYYARLSKKGEGYLLYENKPMKEGQRMYREKDKPVCFVRGGDMARINKKFREYLARRSRRIASKKGLDFEDETGDGRGKDKQS